MRPSYRRLPVLALVMLGALFGHDALMAANPHGRGTSHHAAYGAGEVEPDTQCMAPEATSTLSPEWPLVDTFNVMVSTDVVTPLHREAASVIRGPVPGYPPGVRRALLQVYLN